MSRTPAERRLAIGAGVVLGLVVGGAIVYELGGTRVAAGYMPVQFLVQAPPGVVVRRVLYEAIEQLPEGMSEDDIGVLNLQEWDLCQAADREGPSQFYVYAWTSYRESPWRIWEVRQTWQTYLVIQVDLADGRRLLRVMRPPPPAMPPYILTFPIPPGPGAALADGGAAIFLT